MAMHRFRGHLLYPVLTCAAGFVLAVLVLPARTGAEDKKPAPIKSRVITWDEAKTNKGPWGEMHVHFDGETFSTKGGFAAIAVVQPGKAVHAAHRHAEEEYLIITEGTGVWTLAGKDFPAHKGDALYVEPWVYHGLRNTGDKPLTFVVVKYNSKGVPIPPRPDNEKDELPNP